MAVPALVTITIMIIRLVPMRVCAQSSDCTSTIVSLAPCLNYITGSSSTPSVPCCSQLAKVVQSDPICLCSILNGGASQFGVTLNQTRALALPGACSVQTPPVSRCSGVGSPASSPSGASSAGGGVSRGSFLRPAALPWVVSAAVSFAGYISLPCLGF